MLAVGLIAAGACSNPGVTAPDAPVSPIGPEPSITTITVAPDSSELAAGDSVVFVATVHSPRGQNSSARPVWALSDSALGSLDSTGNFTARRMGIGFVLATLGTAHDSALVRVGSRLGTDGGVVYDGTGVVKLVVPAGAVDSSVLVTIIPGDSAASVPGTSPFQLLPADERFTASSSLTVPYSDSMVAGSKAGTRMALQLLTPSGWAPVEGSVVDTTNRTVTGPIRQFGVYAAMVTAGIALVQVHPDSIALMVGGSQPLSALALDASGATVAASFTWSSGDTTVATVTKEGVVTARDAGLTTISAATQGIAGSALVFVTPLAVGSVDVSPSVLSLAVSDSAMLSAQVRDVQGDLLNRTVTWESSDSGVAAVSQTGTVSARSEGQAVITATSGGVSDSARVSVAEPTLRALAGGHDLLIGTAVRIEALRSDSIYRNVLARQYNAVTPENAMKFETIHPAPDTYDFEEADQIVDFARAHGMQVHGHTLVWHRQLPSWVTSGHWTAAELLSILKDHITTVVSHFRGEVRSWDVVNEAIDWDSAAGWSLRPTLFLETIGPSYIDSAFVWAHRADPSALLYINDFDIEGEWPSAPGWPGKSEALLSEVTAARSRGVPIDGIGVQAHLTLTPPSAQAIYDNLKMFRDAGFLVRISELDVKVPDMEGPASLETEGKIYSEVLDACLRVGCDGFTSWGFTDRYSSIPTHYPGLGRGLPFDTLFQPKPAYDSLVARLRQ
jgi:endo-1,4-beta-xylanase